MNRFIEGLAEIPHAYIDFWVRPCKIWMPQPVTFWRPDNVKPFFVKDTKPLGYWFGHVLAFMSLLAIFGSLV